MYVSEIVTERLLSDVLISGGVLWWMQSKGSHGLVQGEHRDMNRNYGQDTHDEISRGMTVNYRRYKMKKVKKITGGRTKGETPNRRRGN